MSIRVGLYGFGRTGTLVAKEIVADSELSLEWVCRKTVPKHIHFASHALGFDAEFAPFISQKNLDEKFLSKNPVDLIIDFSSSFSCATYEMLARRKIKIVTAISKYSPADLELIKGIGDKVAILSSPNITLGINWLFIASKILRKIIPHADVEIVEEHFRAKPETSGTALKLAEHLDLDSKKHVNSIRVGGVVGRHEVIFGLPYQTLRLTHESINGSAFGTGAIFAGKWLMNKDVGLYKMEHIFHEKFLKHISDLEF